MSVVADSSWASGHGLHIALLVLPMAVAAAIGMTADIRRFVRRRQSSLAGVVTVLAAGCSAVAGLVHVVVCPEHFGESATYGMFFVGAAVAQVGWAAMLWRFAGRRLAFAGLVGNALLVAVWATTRTAGVPLGPDRGEVEQIGLLDVVATTCELGVVACCVVLLVRARGNRVATA